jgi:predicted phage-related endonuclease
MTEVGELITPNGLLVMTAEQMRGGREEWLAARRWREGVPGGFCIGASEVPSILDLEEVDTPAHVYRAKVMNIRREPNDAMLWGNIFEAPIAAEWCRRNRAVIDEIGLVAHKDYPYMQATIDRRVRECPVFKDTPEGECLLEVKHMDRAPAARWHAGCPDRLNAQMRFQLWVTGYSHGHFACKVPGTMKQGIIYADQEPEITEYIIAEVERFRTENLIAGVEPPWNTTDKPLRMIELDKTTHPERDGVAELDINGIDAVHVYAQAAADASAAKKRQDAAKAELMRLANGAAAVKFCDELAYRFGPTTKTKVNLDRLSERYPDAYNDPEVVSETKSHAIYLAAPYKVKPNREDRT